MAKNEKTPEENVEEYEFEQTETADSTNEAAVAKEESTEAKSEIVSDEDTQAASQNELSIEKDKYLRLAAEYDNFRKRSAKEREMIYSDARTDVISKLLPVYDNLERALRTECSDESFYKGVEMIMTQLMETLNNIGVQIIPAVGETFDPNLHNAVMSIEDPNLAPNTVAEEYQKGFTLGDRVIRFSTVVVSN